MNKSVVPLQPDESRDANTGVESEQPETISLADVFRALVKNKWLILVCTIVGLGIAAVYVTLAKPVYEANATIRIDPTRAGSLGLNDLLSLAGGDDSDEQIQTEMSILKSDQVALETLDSLTPEQFRAYAGFDRGSSTFAPAGQQLSRQQENLLGAFKGALTTKQVEGTQLVEIHFQNGSPEVAANIVNHLVGAYIRGNFDSRYNSVNQVKTWLSSQMDELRVRAATAQEKLAQFQQQNDVVGADPSNNTTIDRLKLLNGLVTQAEGDRIVKEAQMRAAETGDPAVLASLMPDAKLQALQQEEANLYAQYIQLSSKFGPGYPPLMEVKKQLAEVKLQIKQNISLVSERLEEDYEASHRAEDMLRGQYRAATEKAYALNRKQADYAVLLAEATSSRDLFDTLQYKLQQASVDAGLNSVNMMVVDRARPPISPIEPKKGLILIFGLVLGAATGIGSALLQESISDQIQSLAQIERGTGLACLAGVPHFTGMPTVPVSGADAAESSPRRRIIAIEEPTSRGAESFRALRNSLLLSSIDNPARIVVITSSLPGEGKSSTAVNYAAVLAQKGERVLLVDSDLRRPTLHTYFGAAKGAGLSDAILGEGGSVDIVTPLPELPNFQFLPAGRKVSLPSEALGSTKFRNMLDGWAKQYDTVILDCAPVLSVSDTVPVASWADAVILVVRAGITPLKALRRSKAVLARAHARVAGALFNDFSTSMADYGYYGKYDDGYYN